MSSSPEQPPPLLGGRAQTQRTYGERVSYGNPFSGKPSYGGRSYGNPFSGKPSYGGRSYGNPFSGKPSYGGRNSYPQMGKTYSIETSKGDGIVPQEAKDAVNRIFEEATTGSGEMKVIHDPKQVLADLTGFDDDAFCKAMESVLGQKLPPLPESTEIPVETHKFVQDICSKLFSK